MVDPYTRIMQAAKSGHGVRLSVVEVRAMAQDDAIATRAIVIQEYPEQWADQKLLDRGSSWNWRMG